jgi:serine/threonine protein kinase
MSAALKSPPKPKARTTLVAGDVVTDPTIGHSYRVEELIGKGMQGEVWRGICLETRVPCAVKTTLAVLSDDPKNLVRAKFEAMALRELRHPNVVQVFASGVREDGGIFMVMELLKGETLQDLLRVRGKLTVRQAIRLVRDVCLGLEIVHQFAIHRDIKPANLYLGLDGVVRLLDLGVCKWKRTGLQLTSTGMQLGTFLYMAPEALDESTALDARADIWSLGIVLYELLTGMSPFAFDSALPASRFLLGNRIINEPHVPLLVREPNAHAFLESIVSKALAKDPENRFKSAEEFGRVLTGADEYLEKMEGPCDPMGELVEEMADRAPTLAPPEPRPAPLGQPFAIVGPPDAAPQTEDDALALAATDEVPSRAPRSASGEYEREPMMPSPSATWDLAMDHGASSTREEPKELVVSGVGREAMWLPSWQPSPTTSLAEAPHESAPPRSADVAVWQPAPIVRTVRPLRPTEPMVAPGLDRRAESARVATVATYLLVFFGLLLGAYLLFGPELTAWVSGKTEAAPLPPPPVASPSAR